MFLGFGIKSSRKVPPICTKAVSKSAARRFAQGATRGLLAAAIALVPILHAANANAQNRKLRLVRDAETEELIRDYARPILKAAGLKPSNIRIHLVNDSRMNAFVVDGKRIFINTGTLITAKTPNEVIGILAHETGHIAGGHLVRLRRAVENAQTMAIIGMLLGAGAATAGAVTGNQNAATVGGGIMMGAPSVAQNSLLNYARTEEIAADRAAVKYLERTGQSAKGMLTTFQRFADQDLFSSRYVDPYIQSHPLPRQRISQIERLAKSSKYYQKKDSPSLQMRHDMVRAKLSGFTQRPKRVMRTYKGNDLPSQYARAIVTYRLGSHKKALRLVDSLIKARPDFPYFWELKGQILLETGSGDKAVSPLTKAVSMRPDEGLLRIMLGQALLTSKSNRDLQAAISHLRRGLQNDPDQPIGYRLLAQAYDQTGQRAQAEMATANGYFAQGDIGAAKAMATRARKKLKRGSPEWLQAEDIIDYKPPRI